MCVGGGVVVVLAGCVSSIADVGLLYVRACVVGRGGWPVCVFEGTWLHVLTFCRVGGWRLRVCA